VTYVTTARQHPVFARFYQRAGPLMERGGMTPHRRALLDGLTGEVIEIGAGTGLNFGHYPPEVARVVAVEPEGRLRGAAAKAAARVPARVEVTDGVASQLLVPDASFDAAVVSLVLCSIPDLAAGLHEIRRVIRPGGELRFLEHVAAQTPRLRLVQRALDATVWPLLFGGCHLSRDTEAAITAAGFTISWLTRVRIPGTRLTLPTTLHIIGAARLAEVT
jgi:ubiquinone/menaquinone biosynthesis C-methylase UbiE